MSGLILTSPFKSKGFSVHVSVTGGTLGSLVPGCSVAPLSIIGSLASVLESEHQGVKVCVVLSVNSMFSIPSLPCSSLPHILPWCWFGGTSDLGAHHTVLRYMEKSP